MQIVQITMDAELINDLISTKKNKRLKSDILKFQLSLQKSYRPITDPLKTIKNHTKT